LNNQLPLPVLNPASTSTVSVNSVQHDTARTDNEKEKEKVPTDSLNGTL